MIIGNMKDSKGRFLKGHKATKDELAKKSESLKKSWKHRDDFHGMYGTKIYNNWRSMITRCNGTCGKDSIKKYKDKGVTVCDRWKDFKNFYEDMSETYSVGLTIDRKDNSKGYFLENCRWATYQEQANNKTNNLLVEYMGKSQTLRQWSNELSISFSAIRNRYYVMYLNGKCDLSHVFRTITKAELVA